MHGEFWQERWAKGQIGFHQDEVNPYLRRHWPGLALPSAARVLVPLCGKSLDLSWLAAQGQRVLGVELAQKAVEDFFVEQRLQPQVSHRGPFRIYSAGALELWCGDFFALRAEHLAECTALYDRAALIALPPEMRRRYAQHLAAIVPAACRGLLVTLDYEQAQMDGPPFAVADAEVRGLLARDWRLQLLEEGDVLADNDRFRQRGLQRLEERVYRLERRQPQA